MKRLRITVEGKTYEVTVEVMGESSEAAAHHPAVPAPSHVEAPAPAESGPAPAKELKPPKAGEVIAYMAGTVAKILVKAGQSVSAGETVLILEAMKMETPLSAVTNGKVEQVFVREGDTVQEGQVLLRIG